MFQGVNRAEACGRLTPKSASTHRPLDGISLRPLIEGTLAERPAPICFWNFNASRESKNEPYIDPKLQEGTTPLVKKLGGKFTRTFRNFHHPQVTERDLLGPRAILDNRFKLAIHDRRDGTAVAELFDLRADPNEQTNLIDQHPDVAEKLRRQLRQWQQSVLKSLTGADYRR